MKIKIINSLIVAMLFFSNSTIAMHGNIVRFVQLLTSGCIIASGAKLSYALHKEKRDFVGGEPVPYLVQKWAHQEMYKLKITHAKSISIVCSQDADYWSLMSDKIIACSNNELQNLQIALCGTDDKSERVVARAAMILKHEMYHYLNDDWKKRIHVFWCIPLGVEISCSAILNGLQKNNLIKKPQTVNQVVNRSSLLIGLMFPKMVMNLISCLIYCRYQERQADIFACKNAHSKIELEEFYSLFQHLDKNIEYIVYEHNANQMLDKIKLEKIKRYQGFVLDPLHPYPLDRSAIVREYLHRWDIEHKE